MKKMIIGMSLSLCFALVGCDERTVSEKITDMKPAMNKDGNLVISDRPIATFERDNCFVNVYRSHMIGENGGWDQFIYMATCSPVERGETKVVHKVEKDIEQPATVTTTVNSVKKHGKTNRPDTIVTIKVPDGFQVNLEKIEAN